MRKNETTDLIDVIAVMEPSGKPMKGMRICISGHLSKSKPEWAVLIEQAGGEFHKTVSYNTTHLCTNADWNGVKEGKVSLKYQKALNQGIKIINEVTLLELIIKEDEAAKTE